MGRKSKNKEVLSAIKDYESSVQFGLTFIFSLFSSAIGGYYFMRVIMQSEQPTCFMVAAIATFFTILVEASLFILKSLKNDEIALSIKR